MPVLKVPQSLRIEVCLLNDPIKSLGTHNLRASSVVDPSDQVINDPDPEVSRIGVNPPIYQPLRVD